jgi:hypothetical protein
MVLQVAQWTDRFACWVSSCKLRNAYPQFGASLFRFFFCTASPDIICILFYY